MSIGAVLAVIVLAVVSIPWWRVVADRRFRQVFPKQAAAIVIALVICLAIAIFVALLVPLSVIIVSGVASVMSVVAVWRSHPRHGRSRGRPPGSLSITRSVRSLAHREAHLDAASRWGRVHKTAQFHRPVVGLVGLGEAREVFRANHSALGASVLPFNERVSGGFLRYMSDADHDRHGSSFRRALGGPTLSGVADATIGALDPLLTLVRREGALSGVDLRSGLAAISHSVCLQTLFGVRPGEDTFRRLSDSIATCVGPPAAPIPRRPDFNRLRSIVSRLPVGDAPSARSAMVDAGYDPFDPIVIDNLVVIQALGTANLAGLFAWVLQHLGFESVQWRSALAQDGGGPMGTAFVSEVLRHSQSEYLYRRVTAEIEIGEYRIPAGWWLRVGVWESHHEPPGFASPAEASIWYAPGATGAEHAPFGIDRHACSGANLSMRASTALASSVAAATDIEVVPASGVVRGFRHWSHWRPDDTLGLRRR